MNTFFGKSWQSWISEYAKSHLNPINRFLHKIGIPFILCSLPLLALGIFYSMPLFVGISFFIFGWILQFVGHIFEGKRPEFFRDWRFLLVGARWWWSTLLKPDLSEKCGRAENETISK